MSSRNISQLPTKPIVVNNQNYISEKVIGTGTFGMVFRAVCHENGDVVAVKKVLQDKRYKNRELQMMQMMSHPNVVLLKSHFYTNGTKADEVYLNLVLEYVPDTLFNLAQAFEKQKGTPPKMPILYSKVFTYQLLRALAYIHSLGICHRDVKPPNLLVDVNTGVLKLCDFGSAKILVQGEPNVAYICSRYYRAPELVFGATNYTPAVDVWSAGCILSELILGKPIFPGSSGSEQIVEIIKVLGTPTTEEITNMNPTYPAKEYPKVKPSAWKKIFPSRTPGDAIDLISKLLVYTPSARLKPFEALLHPFFDQLRDSSTVLQNGRHLPPLFNFSDGELNYAGPAIANKLVPAWYKAAHEGNGSHGNSGNNGSLHSSNNMNGSNSNYPSQPNSLSVYPT